MNLLKWLQSKTKYRVSSDNVFTPTLQEDPRHQESLKRTRKTFEDQQQQMDTRAMKAHAADCPDPWTCTRNPCFKWEPDKIVGGVYRMENKRVKRLQQEQEESLNKHVQFIKDNQEALCKRAKEIQENNDYDSVVNIEDINNKLDI